METDKLHRSDIDQLVDDICVALRESSLETISTCGKVVKTTLYPVGMIMLTRSTVNPEIVTLCGGKT